MVAEEFTVVYFALIEVEEAFVAVVFGDGCTEIYAILELLDKRGNNCDIGLSHQPLEVVKYLACLATLPQLLRFLAILDNKLFIDIFYFVPRGYCLDIQLVLLEFRLIQRHSRHCFIELGLETLSKRLSNRLLLRLHPLLFITIMPVHHKLHMFQRRQLRILFIDKRRAELQILIARMLPIIYNSLVKFLSRQDCRLLVDDIAASHMPSRFQLYAFVLCYYC